MKSRLYIVTEVAIEYDLDLGSMKFVMKVVD